MRGRYKNTYLKGKMYDDREHDPNIMVGTWARHREACQKRGLSEERLVGREACWKRGLLGKLLGNRVCSASDGDLGLSASSKGNLLADRGRDIGLMLGEVHGCQVRRE
jgi:hypothetical protein